MEWSSRMKGKGEGAGGGEALVHRAIIHTTIGTKTRIMATRNQFIEVEYEFILFNCGFPNKQKTKFLSQKSNIYLHTTIPLGYWETCWSKKEHNTTASQIGPWNYENSLERQLFFKNQTCKPYDDCSCTRKPVVASFPLKSTISFNEIFLSHFITLWFLLRSAFRISSNSHLIR